MFPLGRTVPCRVYSVGMKKLYATAAPTTASGSKLKPTSSFTSDTDSSIWRRPPSIEGFQGELPTERPAFRVADARKVLSVAAEVRKNGPSFQGVQGSLPIDDYFGETTPNSDFQEGSYRQGNVLHPTGFSGVSGNSGYVNMAETESKLSSKLMSVGRPSYNQSRNFSTTTANHAPSLQGAQDTVDYGEDELTSDRCPQGIQGDDCVHFKLWMENCQRYHLPNCDEQAEAVKSGRKTLAEVFLEQQQIINAVALAYKARSQPQEAETHIQRDVQGVQDPAFEINYSYSKPCPQGIQGQDCDLFRLWSYNCQEFGFGNCQEQYDGIVSGKRNLQDVFDEQDKIIRQVVRDFQQRRSYSTDSRNKGETEVGINAPPSPSSVPPADPTQSLSQKDRLKKAVKEYGSTVIVFHIGISLVSLGGFYTAVSSGIDLVSLLTKLGVGETILQSRVATGASTFVVAYAVHKVFAPVRIAMTLSCTPLIVRYLRGKGILKPYVPK